MVPAWCACSNDRVARCRLDSGEKNMSAMHRATTSGFPRPGVGSFLPPDDEHSDFHGAVNAMDGYVWSFDVTSTFDIRSPLRPGTERTTLGHVRGTGAGCDKRK